MTTIEETISRLRNTVKGVNADAFLTDRFLYSLVIKYGQMLIRRQDNEDKIMRIQSLFQVIPCVELEEVDKIEACCGGLKSNCTIMRTKERIPEPLEGSEGPLIREVSSIDGSISLYNTNPATYLHMSHLSSFKYNTNKYYWYLDGRLYFPNIGWEQIRLDGIWTESIAKFVCEGAVCKPRQLDKIPIPDYLFAELEQMVMKDLGMLIQIPTEGQNDNESPLRT